jgi:tetratricopeptide (TPR) repeat protein
VALVQTLGPSQVERRLPRVVALGPLVLMGFVVAASLAPPAVAKQLEPWNVRWPTLEAAAFEEAGALTPAAAVYGDTARRFPALAHAHANRGRVASKQGQVLEAAEAFAVARRLAPRDARIALDAAEASLRARAWPEAEAVLVDVLTQYPDDGPAWFTLGKLRLHQQRTLEARAAFEAAEQADWRDWPEGLGVARGALSTLHLAEGNPDLAAALLQKSKTFATPADACGAPSALR